MPDRRGRLPRRGAGGGDAYLLRHILHDWDDAEAIAISRTCRRAIAPDGRLPVVERVIGLPNQGSEAKLADLHMLVTPGGQERTREEYEALLSASGITVDAVIPTTMENSVIEGRLM